MRDTQKQRPAADAAPRTPVILPQPQLFDFVEVEFDLEAPGVGVDRLDGIERKVALSSARCRGT